MDEFNELAQLEESQTSLFKFDKRILFITMQKKIVMIIIAVFIATVIGGIYAKLTVKNKWQARCIMLRHEKNMSNQADMPYLYQDMDYNTVLQSVKMRRNLQVIIDSLKLDTTTDKLYGEIKVERGGRADLINILAYHTDRSSAVGIANLAAEVFINHYVEILNSSTQKIYDFYLAEKQNIHDKIDEKDAQLEKFRKEYHILSLEKETQNKYDNLRELELELMNNQLNLTALVTKISEISKRMKDLPDRVQLETLVTSTNQKQLKNLRSQLSLMKEKYTDKNPKIIKLRKEIEALEAKISNEDDIIPDQIVYGESQLKKNLLLEKTEYENEVSGIKKKITDYQSRIATIKKELKELSPLEKEYYDILNEKTTLLSQLDKIENRLIEVKIAIESNVSDFEIVERAIPPRFPEASGRKIIALVFGFLTFAILFVYHLGKEFLDFSVKSEVDIKEIFKIKLLGEIPRKERVKKEVFYSQIQILFGQIQAQMPDKKTSFFTIGSDLQETGASFIIKELSDLMLSQNKKILWIESLEEIDDDIAKYVINKQLYGASSQTDLGFNELSPNLHKLYFHTNELTYKQILNIKNVNDFISSFHNYDIIFWELFDVHQNLQLFTTIVSVSDLLAFICRFRHSNRTNLQNAIEFLKENTQVPIFGILNDVPPPYFKSKY